MTANEKPNKQIIQQASEWAEELDDGALTQKQRHQLAQWLLKSPEHVNELLIATTLFDACSEVDREKTISIDDLLAQKAPEVLSLLTLSNESLGSGSLKAVWERPYVIAASIAAVVLCGAVLLFAAGPFADKEDATPIYATATGEQRSFPLEDGSVVHLNTATEIRVHLEKEQRNIYLLEGEAMFQVAHDPSRPFRVHTGTAVAEAVGTTFNVYRQEGQTTVAVIEGKVAVENTDASAPELQKLNSDNIGLNHGPDARLLLVAGELADVHSNGQINTSSGSNMKAVTSWRERKFIFERATLTEIAHEYNRYNTLQINVDDPELAAMKFTGVFAVDDPKALISVLEQTADVVVDQSSAQELHLRLSSISTPIEP